jgi:hypothetical protein
MRAAKPTNRCASDRGQAIPMVAVALWLLVAVVLLLATLAGRILDDARAQSAADAAALAAAAQREVADAVARANDAVIVRRSWNGRRAEVIVSRSGARARAAAELAGR